ncbi:MAG TPA: nitrate reductase subunit beta [Miltoncostaeaceae bacterium]|nr:nitrate reductase subunit beta [Miltoncostaeaceae bacterium]
MRIKAQIGMVMNLDKCIGCHTCSVTCKNVWTNRTGAEYMWFNNVETKPGVGYPKRWEDQDERRGGWELNKKGKLELKSGARSRRLYNIFFNPDLPTLDDYYEPFTYDYEHLTTAPPSEHQPVARPKSAISGEPMDIEWGPNWEDDLAGAPAHAPADPNLRGIEEAIKMEYERVFMMYLPRICEHCLNPSCVASCPSGAMYKREEDGIVLVDQEACRGWRMCVSNCPYKKVYFNWQSGKAEKCTLCYPRIEAGMPTICAETCVGRIRYIGVILYDADRVQEAASVPDEHDLLDAQRDVFLDPEDPEVRRQAEADGIPADWIDAARRSPIYALAMRYRVALPLHPEYRTLPMVWYVPPLSPVMGVIEGDGSPADPDDVFPAIDNMRVPIRYLSNLLSAGDDEVVRTVLKQLAAMRRYMRERNLGGEADTGLAASVGMSVADMEDMYRLLAVAKYEDRFVIPTAHTELAGDLAMQQGACGLDFAGGPGSCGVNHGASAPNEVGVSAASPVEHFHLAHAPAPTPAVASPEPPGPATDGCGGGGCGCGGHGHGHAGAGGLPNPGVA